MQRYMFGLSYRKMFVNAPSISANFTSEPGTTISPDLENIAQFWELLSEEKTMLYQFVTALLYWPDGYSVMILSANSRCLKHTV